MEYNHEFTNENIRIIESNKNLEFYVKTISWYSPFEFFTIWVKVESICQPALPQQILKIIDKIIHNRKYFIICEECNKTVLSGNSNNQLICNSCASTNHGIVY